MRLRVEIGLARLAGRLSRAAGKGGGTTLPGRVLCRLDRDAVDVLSSRLPHGSVLVSATNGKTTTSAMVAEIVGPRFQLAHNRAGANLMSGRRLGPRRGGRCRARALRGRRGRLSRRSRGARTRAWSSSRTSSATSSTATASSRSSRNGGAARSPTSGTLRRRSSTWTIRCSPTSCARVRTRCASGSPTRRSRVSGSPTPPTRSTASSAGRRTTTTRPTSAISAPTAAPAATTNGRRST